MPLKNYELFRLDIELYDSSFKPYHKPKDTVTVKLITLQISS